MAVTAARLLGRKLTQKVEKNVVKKEAASENAGADKNAGNLKQTGNSKKRSFDVFRSGEEEDVRELGAGEGSGGQSGDNDVIKRYYKKARSEKKEFEGRKELGLHLEKGEEIWRLEKGKLVLDALKSLKESSKIVPRKSLEDAKSSERGSTKSSEAGAGAKSGRTFEDRFINGMSTTLRDFKIAPEKIREGDFGGVITRKGASGDYKGTDAIKKRKTPEKLSEDHRDTSHGIDEGTSRRKKSKDGRTTGEKLEGGANDMLKRMGVYAGLGLLQDLDGLGDHFADGFGEIAKAVLMAPVQVDKLQNNNSGFLSTMAVQDMLNMGNHERGKVGGVEEAGDKRKRKIKDSGEGVKESGKAGKAKKATKAKAAKLVK